VKCSNVNGEVDVLYDAASVDEEFLSDDWNFRYMHVMAFDKNGVCTQSGNNLVFASVDRNFQNSVKVPAEGFLVAFFYILLHSLVIIFSFGDTHDLFHIKTLSVDSSTTTDHHLLFLVLFPDTSLLHF
jgi:hypothetical protein